MKIGNEQPALKKIQDKPKLVGKIIDYKVIKENGKERKVPVYIGQPNKDIDPDAVRCDYYRVYVDEFDHYKPKSGKNIGIWDTHNHKTTSELHNKWGFNSYYVRNVTEKNNALNAGFDEDLLMGHIKYTNSGYSLAPPADYSMYHLNEPFETESLSKSEVISLANDISPSKLFIASYKIASDWGNYCEDYKDVLTQKANTYMMCDQYYDGGPFCSNDQRYYWAWFSSYYGYNRTPTNWIHLYIDGEDNDFYRLFWKANDFKRSTLWLYAGNKGDKYCDNGEVLTQSLFNHYLPVFCDAAFKNGWLRKFVKRYSYWYKCPDEFGDPCWCRDNNAGWVLDSIFYEGIFEVH